MKDSDMEVNDFKGLEPMAQGPIAPAHVVAAIALNMAVKYHDISTVKDGALYQQYKLEGKNMVPLHLDMVFETAIRMEVHLLGASDRIAKLIIDSLEVGIAEAETQEGGETPKTT